MNQIDEQLLESIADLHGTPAGAYNIRKNGAGVARQSSANIEIIPKQDKPGIDIIVKPHTKNESVHIPVIVTDTGINDMVYNHFEIGEGADILIVAGCGIHNDGSAKSEHDGIHTFHIGKKRPRPLCRKALWGGRWQRRARIEPDDRGGAGGRRLLRDGDGADQGR